MSNLVTETEPDEPKVKAPKLWRDVALHRSEHGGQLKPAKDNPYCLKCKLMDFGCKQPLEAWGAEEPTLTVAFDAVAFKEDDANIVACEGSANGLVRKTLAALAKDVKFDMDKVRWLPLSRCANRTKGKVNYKTRVNWCRSFAIEDIRLHPPRMILAIGSVALGALSHKGNANDWSGKLLTFRGWPDDWLTDLRFLQSHPVGLRPADDFKIPLWAVQAPRLVYMLKNERQVVEWRHQLKRCLKLAQVGTRLPEYDRSYYEIVLSPERAADLLDAIPADVVLSYDTETTGLLPFVKGAKIVTHMFKYTAAGKEIAFGLPWDFPGSPLGPFLHALRPKLLQALYRTKVQGHNLSFDILFVYATEAADLRQLTEAMSVDTRHLLYCIHQSTESLGLELVAYSWCPELAGYEEEFTMLKEREDLAQKLDPAKGEGGHYANALLMPDLRIQQAFKTYVMGDVEVVDKSTPRMRKRLDESEPFKIPLANPALLGTYRRYTTPPLSFVYDKLMLRAQRTLTRMMGRGMYVDQEELKVQEDLFPKLIVEARNKLRVVDEQIVRWCEQQEATVVGKDGKRWQLDLESRDQLKMILFTILQLPVERLTDSGDKLFGDINKVPADKLLEYAAIDKFTLTSMVAEHPQLEPLKEYRKLYKAYSMFVRSMRNIKTEGVDKKDREKHPYLMPDSCVHTSFQQCGTASGRLSDKNPNLQQIIREGVGSMVKRLFASRFGKAGCMYQFDLSQIELRLIAATSGDPTMVQAYRDGTDLHSLTTSRVFKIPYEHFEKSYMADLQAHGKIDEAKKLNEKRSIGKTTNFLTGYGGGAFGLHNSLAEEGVYLDVEECERIVDAMFDTYPALRMHIGLYKRFVMNHGCAVSVFGRVRPLEDAYSDDGVRQSKALRSGYNHLIQSTASDLMLSCCSILDDLFYDQGLESMLVSTVHDSIVIDAKRSELPAIHDLCCQVINNMPAILPFIYGPDVDLSWLSVVPIEGEGEVGVSYHEPLKIIEDPVTKQVDWDRLLNPVQAST